MKLLEATRLQGSGLLKAPPCARDAPALFLGLLRRFSSVQWIARFNQDIEIHPDCTKWPMSQCPDAGGVRVLGLQVAMAPPDYAAFECA